MDATIEIRPAQPGDGAGLAVSWLESARYYTALDPQRFQVPSDEGLVEWFDELLARPLPSDEVWLVAEVGGHVAGDVQARLERPVPSAARQVMRILGQTRLYVNELGVAEAYRRRGVATRLLTSAERWGREHGATLVYLDTYAYSPLSVPFYEHRMGYRRASITFEKRLEG